MRIGYMRLSQERQAEGDTLQNHRVRLEAVPCDRIFCDLQSGWKDSEDREQFQALLALAKELRAKNEAVEIYFGRIDRWGRSTTTNVVAVEELEAIGCKLYSLETGEVSTSTPGGWLSLSQQSVIAEYYSRQLSYNVSQALKQKRLLNKPLGSFPPLGLKLADDKSKYELDDRPFQDTGRTGYQIAREMIDLYLDTGSLYKVSDYLKKKYGIRRQAIVLSRWMKNPSLRGHLWYYDPPKNKALKQGMKLNEIKKVIVHNQHNAIIAPDEWRIMDRLLMDSQKLKGANRGRTYPLQRLCRCSLCGGGLSRNRSTRNKAGDYHYNMRCYNRDCPGRTMSLAKIESEVIEFIQEHIEGIQEEFAAEESSTKPPELLELERRRQEIQELYDKNPMEGLQIALNSIDKEIAELIPDEDNEDPSISKEELLLLAQALNDTNAWLQTSPDSKRIIYMELIRTVIVDLNAKKVLSVDLRL